MVAMMMGEVRWCLELLVRAGAPSEILNRRLERSTRLVLPWVESEGATYLLAASASSCEQFVCRSTSCQPRGGLLPPAPGHLARSQHKQGPSGTLWICIK